MDPGAVLLALLGHPDLCCRAWVTRQYDSTVGADTVAGSEHGAAVLRVKGTTKGLVMATDACAARGGCIDPCLGAALAVAECTRNVAITGARPLGVTNCLNYGDPTRPEAFWQLSEASAGWATRAARSACRSPAATSPSTTSQPRGAIAPTAQIGVVGLLDDVDRRVGPVPRGAGDVIGLLGTTGPGHGRVGLCDRGRARTRRPAARPSTWPANGRAGRAPRRPRRVSWRRRRMSSAAAGGGPRRVLPVVGPGRDLDARRRLGRRPSSCSARPPAGSS